MGKMAGNFGWIYLGGCGGRKMGMTAMAIPKIVWLIGYDLLHQHHLAAFRVAVGGEAGLS